MFGASNGTFLVTLRDLETERIGLKDLETEIWGLQVET